MKAEYEAEFMEILGDISKLPTEKAEEAIFFIADLLLCVGNAGEAFCIEAKRLCDNGEIEAFKKLVERESRALKLGSLYFFIAPILS